MKKIFLSLAVVAATMVAYGSASAQNIAASMTENTTAVCKEKSEQCGKTESCRDREPKCDRGHHGKKDKRFDKKRKCCGGRAFEGITLTETQKTQIEKIQKDRKGKIEKLRAEHKKKMVKHDNDFDKQLQKVLTPEQYAQYQSNRQKARMDKGDRKRGDRKGDGKFMCRERRDKASCAGERAPRHEKGTCMRQICPEDVKVAGEVGPTVKGPEPKKDYNKR